MRGTFAEVRNEQGSGDSQRPPAPGILSAALIHAGIFGLGLSLGVSPPLTVPGGALVVWGGGATLLAMTLLALVRFGTGWLVVPAAILATLAWVGVDTSAQSRDLQAVAEVVRLGALGVAVSLSLAASLVAARQPTRLSLSQVLSRASLQVGLGTLALLAALAVVSGRPIGLPAFCAITGVVGVAVLAAQNNLVGARVVSMMELLGLGLFSMGSIWAASLFVGTGLGAGGESVADRGLGVMRFAWLAAFPVLAALLVAAVPRVTLLGAAVLRYPRVAATVVLGVAMCVGLARGASRNALATMEQLRSSVASARVEALPERAGTTEVERRRPSPSSSSASPVVAPVASSDSPVDSAVPSAAPTDATPTDAVPTDAVPAATAVEAEVRASERLQASVGPSLIKDGARVSVTFSSLDGPLAESDAVNGIKKGLKHLIRCYEKSTLYKQALRLPFRVNISGGGSVKQAESQAGPDVEEALVTCVTLSFYRSGYASAPRSTALDLVVHFGVSPQ